jgi:hypothetical protein
MKTLPENLLSLKKQIKAEYDYFSTLSNMPDRQLRKHMKDSDWDAFKDGLCSQKICIDLFSERCLGRAIQAGNDYSRLRAELMLAKEILMKN